jgi:putative transposase
VSQALVKRACRFRFYPTEEQAVELSRTFGCVRLVYNRALDARTPAWYQEQRRVGYTGTSALLTARKRTDESAFLNEVSSVPSQQGLRHLQRAFTHFFDKRAEYPKFKSRKKSRASAEYTGSAFRWRDGLLSLAKMDQPLDIVWSRRLPDNAEPSTVTVSRDPAGRWHVAIQVETTIDHLVPIAAEVGVDAGLTSLSAVSTGEKITNPRHGERVFPARAQRNLARGSDNRAKARTKVARVHARITDRRRDLPHKLTTRLVPENHTIVIEDLAVRNMVGAISDASWSDFRTMPQYEGECYGRTAIVVDRWYPSSKTCSRCGHLLDALPLGVREWTCPGRGDIHDRDVDAARNIPAAGRAVATCGDGVGPIRRQSVRHLSNLPSRGKKQELSVVRWTGIPALQGREDVKSAPFRAPGRGTGGAATLRRAPLPRRRRSSR